MSTETLIEERHVELTPPEYPVHELIAQRCSIRAFSPRAVEPEKIRSIMEAARWAPSSFNQQPWFFIVARKEEEDVFSRTLGALNHRNASWASNAPVLFLVVTQLFIAGL